MLCSKTLCISDAVGYKHNSLSQVLIYDATVPSACILGVLRISLTQVASAVAIRHRLCCRAHSETRTTVVKTCPAPQVAPTE